MNKLCQRGKLLILTGCCCILAAAALYGYNSWVSAQAFRESQNLLSLLQNSANASYGETEFQDPALSSPASKGTKQLAAKNVGGYDVIGTLEADVIGIKLPVISDWSYPKLREAPCRYCGAPDTQMVLLAHNYADHFGRLKNMKKGDTVTFTDVKNRVFRYRVIRVETIPGDEMNVILSGHDWNLTLFTCTFSGAERVVARCCRY